MVTFVSGGGKGEAGGVIRSGKDTNESKKLYFFYDVLKLSNKMGIRRRIALYVFLNMFITPTS